MKQIALYNDTTDSGTPVAAIVQQQRNGNYEVVMINIAPFYEAVEIFDDAYEACNVAQKRLQEYITRLNERDAVNAEWPNGYPQAEPVDVDMGGDFEGFIEAVNAQPAAQVWYTEPVTSADGEKIMARVTEQHASGGYLIEVLANGMALAGYSATVYGRLIAQATAREMAEDTVAIFNAERAIEMGDETETVGKPDLTRKHDRMAEIRRKLERLDRERDSLMFELAQLTGE